MNANNMLDWEQYVKQYVVVYQCHGAELRQWLLSGDAQEGHFEMNMRAAHWERRRAWSCPALRFQTQHGNAACLHLPPELSHLLKGKFRIIHRLQFNARQICCSWEKGTMKQTLIQKSGSAVMWIDINISRAEKQTLKKYPPSPWNSLISLGVEKKGKKKRDV